MNGILLQSRPRVRLPLLALALASALGLALLGTRVIYTYTLLFGLFLLITYITLHALIQLGSGQGGTAASARAVPHEG